MRKPRGVHPNSFKNTGDCETKKIAAPAEVEIPMLMHIGAECIPTVKMRDKVFVGTVIGDSDAFCSIPIHSSVSGTVKKIANYTTAGGAIVSSIIIENDMEDKLDESIKAPKVNTREDFVKAVRASGLVGLGGAGFPTHIKLALGDKVADTLVINFAECEPYITSNVRAAIEDTDDIIEGINLTRKYLGIKKCIIGVERNKAAAVNILKERLKGETDIEIKTLPAVYPQGAEKILIYNTLKRVVEHGKLPIDVGVVVMNIATVAFISKYLKTGMPLVSKRVTLDGKAIKNPCNYEVLVGTRIGHLIESTGGLIEDPAKIIMDGPMMGKAVPSTDYGITKTSSAILALMKEEVAVKKTTNCIKCGRCVDHCPYSLRPEALEKAYDRDDFDTLVELNVNACMECGCCSFVCPAGRPLAEKNSIAKSHLRNIEKKRRENNG